MFGLSKKNKPVVYNHTVESELNNHLNLLLSVWVETEVADNINKNTKLMELVVFNFKTIYGQSDNAKALREYFFSNKTIASEEDDFLFSRILDLYVTLGTQLPAWFLTKQRESHIRLLKELGYTVDNEVVKILPYGWLLAKLQFTIRYVEKTS